MIWRALVAGGLGVAIATERCQSCANRSLPHLTLRRWTPFGGLSEQHLPLKEIAGAATEAIRSPNALFYYRPMLVMRDGTRHPVCRSRTVTGAAARAANDIDRWLHAVVEDTRNVRMRIRSETANRLEIDTTPWVFGVFLVLFLVVMCGLALIDLLQGEGGTAMVLLIGGGAIVLYAALMLVERAEMVLDRVAGTAILRSRHLLGRAEVTHPLSAVVMADASSLAGTGFPVVLVMTDGTRLPIRRMQASKREAARIVAAVNRWLQRDMPPPSPTERGNP